MNIPLETCDTVIFDIGNVLVKYDWVHCMEPFRFATEIYDAVAGAMFKSQTWQDGDLGVYGKDDWCDAFAANAPAYEKEIRSVYAQLDNCILPTGYTDELLRFFRERGFSVYYLSNYSEGLFEKTKDTLSFLKDFNGGVFSWKEHLLKPDALIYQTLLKRYGICPEKALFFDDLQKNVDAACREGINGVLFTPSIVPEILQKR